MIETAVDIAIETKTNKVVSKAIIFSNPLKDKPNALNR